MNYKLIKSYTEKLSVTSFHQLVKNDEITLGVNLNTSLIPSKDENIYLLKIDYGTRAIDNPISLNWTGICILKFNEKPTKMIKADTFLENEEIENFINESIDKFSFFIGGDLPKLLDLKRKNKND